MHGPLHVSSTSRDELGADPTVDRYDISIFDTPFSALPNPKRVWLGAPSSPIEGLGNA